MFDFFKRQDSPWQARIRSEMEAFLKEERKGRLIIDPMFHEKIKSFVNKILQDTDLEHSCSAEKVAGQMRQKIRAAQLKSSRNIESFTNELSQSHENIRADNKTYIEGFAHSRPQQNTQKISKAGEVMENLRAGVKNMPKGHMLMNVGFTAIGAILLPYYTYNAIQSLREKQVKMNETGLPEQLSKPNWGNFGLNGLFAAINGVVAGVSLGQILEVGRHARGK
jgi:hypothetical protein